MMNRHETFLWMLQAVIAEYLPADKAIDAMAAVLDPNVQMMISGDAGTPIEQKVKEYFAYITGGKKPFWLTKGE